MIDLQLKRSVLRCTQSKRSNPRKWPFKLALENWDRWCSVFKMNIAFKAFFILFYCRCRLFLCGRHVSSWWKGKRYIRLNDNICWHIRFTGIFDPKKGRKAGILNTCVLNTLSALHEVTNKKNQIKRQSPTPNNKELWPRQPSQIQIQKQDKRI